MSDIYYSINIRIGSSIGEVCEYTLDPDEWMKTHLNKTDNIKITKIDDKTWEGYFRGKERNDPIEYTYKEIQLSESLLKKINSKK